MSSLSERFSDTCAACGLEHEVELWFVVDEDERPDLIRAVIEGDTLREIPCPRCGEAVVSYDPLLVYRPRRGGVKAVLLTHCEHLEVEKKREAASYLLGRLEQTLGVPDGETVVLEVPWRLMPEILTRNFETDVASPDHLLRLPDEIAPSTSPRSTRFGTIADSPRRADPPACSDAARRALTIGRPPRYGRAAVPEPISTHARAG